MFLGQFKPNPSRPQVQVLDWTGNPWSCCEALRFKTAIFQIGYFHHEPFFPKLVAWLWFLHMIGLCSYVCLSWSLADASLCKISMVISDAEGAGRAVSFLRSLWEPLCAVLLALWDVATPASLGPYLPEADCKIWYASAKWSEMTISKNKIRELNDMSQHHSSLILSLYLSQYAVQYADLFQLLICHSKVKYTRLWNICLWKHIYSQAKSKQTYVVALDLTMCGCACV